MMNKSKSIKVIYNEVKNFDLVITNDVSLASALNKNVSSPRLGLLSMTPRQLALKYGQIFYDRLYSKSELVLEVYKHSKKPLRYIHQSIEKIFEIWNHTGLIESCELYLGQEKELLKYFAEFKTVEYVMENFDEDFYGNKKIAVAGFELFNVLDQQVLPKKNVFPEKIELLTEDEFTFNENKTYLFNSVNDLINSVTSLLTKQNQNDAALIFNTDSELKNIFISGLKQKGINPEIRSFLRDDISVGKYLSFIESSFNISEYKVKDILFTESLFGINISRKVLDFNLSGYVAFGDGKKTLLNVYELMTGIEKITFLDLLNKIEFISGKKFNPELRSVLYMTEFGEKKITVDNFNVLKYFILNFDIETVSSECGVLFVNASNAAFVDRAVTIFIGMDDSWTRLNTDKAYVEKAAEEKKDLEKFQILLSQGEEKIYTALNIKKNQPVVPCYYFNMLSEKDIKGFEDDFFNPVFALNKPVMNKVKKTESQNLNSGEPKYDSMISPSTLNAFYTCPKNFSYSRLIPQEEKSYFLKGTLLHNFAELYFNHPEYAKKNFNKLLDIIMKKYSGFLWEMNKDKERTAFKIGMKVIMDFIDSQEFEYDIDTSKDTIKTKRENNRDRNELLNETGLKRKYLNTENWITKSIACIRGKIDLTSGQTIVDYKSSRSGKSETVLISEYKINLLAKDKADSANFQTIAYLAGKREDNPDQIILFVYLYLLLNYSDYIKGTQDPEKSITAVKYIPETFKRYIVSEDFFHLLYSEKNELFLNELGCEKFRELILESFDEINFYDKNSITEKLEDKIHDYLILEKNCSYRQFGRTKESTFKSGEISALLSKIHKARIGSKEFPHIYKDEVDEFLIFAKQNINEINECFKNDFPNRPVNDLRSVCLNCDFLNICIGNKLLTADEI